MKLNDAEDNVAKIEALEKDPETFANKFKQNQIYEDCEMVLNEAKKNIADIDALQEDPENFIYSYFEEIKKQVDLRREELKLKLDL